jgi:hypothetical protein
MTERDNPDRRPIPDPTVLTTQQLQREVASLKEIIFTRLDANDKAVQLLHQDVTRVPTDTDKQIAHLKELHNEKFISIENQFKERDVRMEQEARNNKISLDAALQAAEKAVNKQNETFALSINKSENATNKQIDQQAALIHTSNNALESKISDLKDRVTIIEGKSSGQIVAQTSTQINHSFLVAVFVACVSFAGLLVVIIREVMK